MNSLPLLVAAFAVIPVIGAATWVWLAMASATDDMRSFVDVEGIHFED